MSTPTIALGHYVYAFVRSNDADAIARLGLEGLNGMPLRAVTEASLCAIVSDIPVEKIRPRRQLLAAHQSVVTTISKHYDMLPVAFGLIADSGDELSRLIRGNNDMLIEQLARVGGHVEMNVSLSIASENPVQFFVDQSPELQAARQLLASGKATRDEMIELGRVFERYLNAKRGECQAKLIEAIKPYCKEVDTPDPRNEGELARLNCLIHRDSNSQFDAQIEKIAAHFSDDYVFNLSGPWPPYSFVAMSLTSE